jgi:Gpi18-like mannosyltransferase
MERRDSALLAAGLLVGVFGRLLILPTAGMTGDIDTFVGWVHSIAVNGLPNAYDEKLSFPPVMAYIWGLLGLVEPGFRAATDSTDLTIRILMKLPPVLADFGLALLVGYALRERPRWALLGMVGVLIHPGIIDASAWWGQYESIYLLSALAAAVLAMNGRNGWAAALIAVSLMTKPQALPMLVPFAAWFWATGGWRGFARASAIGVAVIVLLWLPFIAAGGPGNYLRNVATYQGEQFAVLSLWAWNVWWLIQEVAGNGNFITDRASLLGPLTLRHVGFVVTGLLELVVALAVLRDPRPRTFILALVASILIAFSFLTAMHERYSYGAVIFLLLLPESRFRWLSLAFGIAFTLNLLAAVPPTQEIGSVLRVSGALGVLGSLAMLSITVVVYTMLARRQGNVAPA